MCISSFSCLFWHITLACTGICDSYACVLLCMCARNRTCLFCFVCACVHVCTTPGPVPLGASRRHRAPDIAERLSIAAFQSWCNNDAGLHFSKVEIRGLKEERQPPVRRSSLTPPPPSLRRRGTRGPWTQPLWVAGLLSPPSHAAACVNGECPGLPVSLFAGPQQ